MYFSDRNTKYTKFIFYCLYQHKKLFNVRNNGKYKFVYKMKFQYFHPQGMGSAPWIENKYTSELYKRALVITTVPINTCDKTHKIKFKKWPLIHITKQQFEYKIIKQYEIKEPIVLANTSADQKEYFKK